MFLSQKNIICSTIKGLQDMLKPFIALAFAMAISAVATAQQRKISVLVTDSVSSEPLSGAYIQSLSSREAAITSPSGEAVLQLPDGVASVKVSYLGFKMKTFEVSGNESKQLVFALPPAFIKTADVIVTGINTNAKGGFAYTNIGKEEIAKQNFGQDIPFLLNLTPSAVATSDAGAGVGYTGLRIRGSDATRINMTLNGIPVNDAESQSLYWVNMPDLASSTSNLQIQRGVGTSTTGSASFGGSINVKTDGINTKPYLDLTGSYGSFNTNRKTLKLGTGLIGNHFTADIRLSQIGSDGYMDRASSDLKSFYASGNYFTSKTHLKLVLMSGKEKTYQAWNGVPAELYESNRTYNSFTYANQTDNYQQDHYQLHADHVLGEGLTLGGALFYTYGRGYYEEAQNTSDPYASTSLSTYGISPITLGMGTVLATGDVLTKDSVLTNTDVIRRQWLDNRFYGGLFTLNYQKDNLNVVFGGGISQYHGLHYGELVWARYAGNTNIYQHYYDNTAVKNDGNLYTKLTWDITNKLAVFGDIQYRQIGYSFEGLNAIGKPATQQVSLQMMNPKAGLSLKLTDKESLFASFAMAHREPNRNDYVNAINGNRPQMEKLYDFEGGLRSKHSKHNFGITMYYMNYQNQLVLTGKLNEVGEAIRTNIGSSYRAGIELEASVYINKIVNWAGNITLSTNKVRTYNELILGYSGPADYIRNVYDNTSLAFSPNVIGSSQLLIRPLPAFEVSFITKYVSKQYLDNTGSDYRALSKYITNDLRLAYTLHLKSGHQVVLGTQINNIFNNYYASNGYTYRDKNTDNTINTYTYYFPQAGRNFLVMLSVKI